MLQITVQGGESYDEEANLFNYGKPYELRLEHSLVSISKWEMKWEAPFLKSVENKSMTDEQLIDYIKCMTMNQNVPDDVYTRLTMQQISDIWAYTKKKQSAAWIVRNGKGNARSGEVVTSDLIYYWMFHYGIDKECEKWHLNRLLMLIDIFAIKSSPGKKMSKNEILQQNRALNQARKAKYNTRG